MVRESSLSATSNVSRRLWFHTAVSPNDKAVSCSSATKTPHTLRKYGALVPKLCRAEPGSASGKVSGRVVPGTKNSLLGNVDIWWWKRPGSAARTVNRLQTMNIKSNGNWILARVL